jgi:hypothetical protein
MKVERGLFILITSLVLLFSCGQPVDHNKEVMYYVTLTKIRVNTAEAFQNCVQEIHIVYLDVSMGKTLDSNSMKKMNESYLQALDALNVAIQKLSAIKEIDDEIKLKEQLLTYYKGSKGLLEQNLPGIIKMLSNENGLDNVEREYFRNFSYQANQLNSNETILDDLFVELRDKHHITGEDIKNTTH